MLKIIFKKLKNIILIYFQTKKYYVLMLKIIFKKLKNIILIYFQTKKYFKKLPYYISK